MIEIKDLLKRFNSLLLGEFTKKEAVRDTLEKILGVSIKSEDIKIQNATVYLNVKPIIKNEILIKRAEIDNALYEIFKERAPRDIR